MAKRKIPNMRTIVHKSPAKLATVRLIEKISDLRKGKQKDTVVFSPVGDKDQLLGFYKHVKKLGIEKEVDFIFLYRKGLKIIDKGFSAIHGFEKYPLGTAGCFFSGQDLAYRLGYKLIIVADLDAFLDSKKTFHEMARLALETGKVVSPVSTCNENMEKYLAYNFNQWSFFPRKAFEKVGFSIPYLWKGGDDYELMRRYKSKKQSIVYNKGIVLHPMVGYTVFHKIGQKGKQYPYVGGLLKSLLFVSTYDAPAILKYLMWYSYYSYIADAFDAHELRKIISDANQFILHDAKAQGKQFFSVEKVRESGKYSNVSPKRVLLLPAAFLCFLAKGYYDIYIDRVTLKISKLELLARILKGTVLIPVRLVQGVLSIGKWKKSMKKVPFPITASNLDNAEKRFEELVKNRRI